MTLSRAATSPKPPRRAPLPQKVSSSADRDEGETTGEGAGEIHQPLDDESSEETAEEAEVLAVDGVDEDVLLPAFLANLIEGGPRLASSKSPHGVTRPVYYCGIPSSLPLAESLFLERAMDQTFPCFTSLVRCARKQTGQTGCFEGCLGIWANRFPAVSPRRAARMAATSQTLRFNPT